MTSSESERIGGVFMNALIDSRNAFGRGDETARARFNAVVHALEAAYPGAIGDLYKRLGLPQVANPAERSPERDK